MRPNRGKLINKEQTDMLITRKNSKQMNSIHRIWQLGITECFEVICLAIDLIKSVNDCYAHRDKRERPCE